MVSVSFCLFFGFDFASGDPESSFCECAHFPKIVPFWWAYTDHILLVNKNHFGTAFFDPF